MQRLAIHFRLAGLFVVTCLTAFSQSAWAHGERNQENFLRMRTIHFYDMKWSVPEDKEIKVNDQITITGRFRTFEDWPNNLPAPDTAFLSTGGPGSVMTKVESYINGTPMIQSTNLKLNRDYDFKLVMRARIPGRYHIHPTLMVENAGPIAGPGFWVKISGSHADYAYPAKTLSGETIPNLETWGVASVVGWQGFWAGVGLVWLLWWLRRPLLIPRYIALVAGREDVLITRADRIVGAMLAVGVVAVVGVSAYLAEAKYPKTVPLQAGKSVIEPLPEENLRVKADVMRATYDVPGRSLKMSLKVTNNTDHPVELGEFLTANVRFINRASTQVIASVSADYPKELMNSGLRLKDSRPLSPGETRELEVDASDAMWEVERLTDLLNGPVSRFGGLLFFYGQESKRHVVSVSAPIMPVFMNTAGGRGERQVIGPGGNAALPSPQRVESESTSPSPRV